MSDDLEKFLKNSHKGITTFEIEGESVPCIIVDEKKYDEIISKVAGKPYVIDTNFNILQDGMGHVFVEVLLDFSIGNIKEKFLVNAGKDLLFFRNLAKTSKLVISSPQSTYGKETIIGNYLPHPEKAREALEIIEKGLRRFKN